jgi:uncharacterized membrane protein
MCTDLKGFFVLYLQVEEKGLGQGLVQESDAGGFYSRIRISMMQDLLSLMFPVALLWIFKQETTKTKYTSHAPNIGFRSLHLELYSLYPVKAA